MRKTCSLTASAYVTSDTVEEEVFDQLLQQISTASANAILGTPFVVYLGVADVVDAGGVWRSVSHTFATQMFTSKVNGCDLFSGPDYEMFPSNVTFVNNNFVCRNAFETFGIYMLLAAVNGGQFPRRIAKFVLQYIFDEGVEFDDVATACMCRQYAWLTTLKSYSGDEVGLFGPTGLLEGLAEDIGVIDTSFITLEIDYHNSGNQGRLQLWKKGLISAYFVKPILASLEALKKGFFIAPVAAELRLCAQTVIDVFYRHCSTFSDFIYNCDIAIAADSDSRQGKVIDGLILTLLSLDDSNSYDDVDPMKLLCWVQGIF